jgi:aspartyl protease family protein
MLKYALYWLLILVILVFLYSFKDDYTNIKHRFIGALFPSTVIEEGGVITVKLSNNGHFMINTYINGSKAVLLVDTGATSVVLSRNVAKHAGIDVSKLGLYHEVIGANGTFYVGEAKVDIRIGNFEVKNFPVLVNASDIDESLLGMTLLNEFKSFSIEGDTLHLTY